MIGQCPALSRPPSFFATTRKRDVVKGAASSLLFSASHPFRIDGIFIQHISRHTHSDHLLILWTFCALPPPQAPRLRCRLVGDTYAQQTDPRHTLPSCLPILCGCSSKLSQEGESYLRTVLWWSLRLTLPPSLARTHTGNDPRVCEPNPIHRREALLHALQLC